MIQNGAKVNDKDDQGRRPLHAAVVANACEVAEVLIQNGAKVNDKATLRASISPRLWAVLEKKDFNFAEFANVCTPLHAAALSNACEVAEVLLKNGAKVNVSDYDDRTPLHYAALSNAYEVAEVLLKNGAYVDVSDSIGFFGKVPIAYADGKTAKLLLRYSSD